MAFELTAATPQPGPDAADAVPVIEVRGEVDINSADSFRDALAELAAPTLVADLSGVAFLDSAGFAVLDHLIGRAMVAVVVSPGSVIRAAITLMNLPFHDTVQEAAASLRPA